MPHLLPGAEHIHSRFTHWTPSKPLDDAIAATPADLSTDVVIVNWNSGAQLATCIRALERSEEASSLNIIVVDNASADGSCVTPANGRVIENCRNTGFAVACNQGAAAGRAPYILFLNPDTEVPSGAIAAARSVLADSPATGVVGIQLRDQQGRIQRSCARQPTVATMLSHALGLSRLLPASGYIMNEWDHGADRDVDHVIGAFYLIRRELFESLSGFDERFFLYLEDVDLSRRVLDSGFRIRYLSGVGATHVGGGTSAQIPDTRLYLSLRARLTFADKHFGRLGVLLITMVTVLIEPIVRLLGAMLRSPGGGPGNVLRAYRQLFAWLRR